MTSDNAKCEDRIDSHLKGRMADLRKLWNAETKGKPHPELGSFGEYGLSFDYVAAHTFEDQKEGYFRYQLSWGGPSDEFRYFTDAQMNISRVEYWFLDWFDGAHRVLAGKNYELVAEIFEDFFKDLGVCEKVLNDATD